MCVWDQLFRDYSSMTSLGLGWLAAVTLLSSRGRLRSPVHEGVWQYCQKQLINSRLLRLIAAV